jgi:hypothetical protein
MPQYYGKLVSGVDRMLLFGATPIPQKFDDRSVGGRSTRNSVRRRVFERCRSIREMEELDRALEGCHRRPTISFSFGAKMTTTRNCSTRCAAEALGLEIHYTAVPRRAR